MIAFLLGAPARGTPRALRGKSYRTLAKQLGVSPQAVYRHFLVCMPRLIMEERINEQLITFCRNLAEKLRSVPVVPLEGTKEIQKELEG